MKTAQVEVQKNNINKSVFTNQALLKKHTIYKFCISVQLMESNSCLVYKQHVYGWMCSKSLIS